MSPPNPRLGRREWLALALSSGAALALPGLSGCASRPAAAVHHALFTFTNVDRKPALQRKFSICIQSLAAHLALPDKASLVLHFVADAGSTAYGKRVLEAYRRPGLDFVFHDKDELVKPILPLIESLQKHFGGGPGGQFHDPIFFLSVGLHRVLPPDIRRLVKLDFDLMFASNLIDVFQRFDTFQEGNVIGIAPELQPAYARALRTYREENPGTRAGSPRPGLQGVNAGVMLLALERMRASDLYNACIESAAIGELVAKYRFKGNLGDQDLYTLLSFEHEALFHHLDCTYNRQLCTWWEERSEKGTFEAYHACPGEPKIYHGNCSTPIPGAELYEPLAPAAAGSR